MVRSPVATVAGCARAGSVVRSVLVALVAAGGAACSARAPDATEAVLTNVSSLSVVTPDGRSRVYDLRHQGGVAQADVTGSPSAVWAVLPSVFEYLDIEVTRVDASAAVMGNTGYRARRIEGERLSRFVDCGRGPMRPFADEYEVTLSVMVQLIAGESEVTTVRTLVDGFARDRTMSSGGIHCISFGSLERRIGELVAERLDG